MLSAVMHALSSSSTPTPPSSTSSLLHNLMPQSILLHCANRRVLVALCSALNEEPSASSSSSVQPESQPALSLSSSSSPPSSLWQSYYPHIVNSALSRTSPALSSPPNNIGCLTIVATHLSNTSLAAASKALTVTSSQHAQHLLLLLISSLASQFTSSSGPLLFTIENPPPPTIAISCLLKSPSRPKVSSVCIPSSFPATLLLLPLLPPLASTITSLHLPNCMPTHSKPVLHPQLFNRYPFVFHLITDFAGATRFVGALVKPDELGFEVSANFWLLKGFDLSKMTRI
jgi:hypothetical protein